MLLATTLLASCSTASPVSAGTKLVHGGTVTYAEQPGSSLNYIFPFMSTQYFDGYNSSQFQWLMYQPLYWLGSGSTINNNARFSLARPPVFSNHNKTITVNMSRAYRWSNGEPVDAADVIFWMNMLKAEKDNWAGYVPGAFPDNVVSYTSPARYTIVFRMDKSYSPGWLWYSELTQITPLPLAWDLTAAAHSGTCAKSVAGCASVYKYLSGLSTNVSTFATNPLWQIVDGPWRLESFTPQGGATFVPNKHYTGPNKPHISRFVELPFTSSAAEYSVLRSSQTAVDVGYVPVTLAPPVGSPSSVPGHVLAPWAQWSINFVSANFNNPRIGPVFDQLYFRQAVQELVNQSGYIRAVYHGYANPVYGPVPLVPASKFVSPGLKRNPYPYDPSRAVAALRAHGWKVLPGGTSYCARPGAGPSECGSGVPAGDRLSFSMVYPSGSPSLTAMFGFFASSMASQAGFQITLRTESATQIFGSLAPCTPTQAACSWQLLDWEGWTWSPSEYPTSGGYLEPGGAFDANNYSNKAVTAAITAAHEGGLGALYREETLIAHLLPEIWVPNFVFQITAIKSDLKGVTPQAPSLAITPSMWYYTAAK